MLWSWAEVEHDVGPPIRRVTDGETVYFEDLHLRVQRGGAPEDPHSTFSYSPVRVESGEVGAA